LNTFDAFIPEELLSAPQHPLAQNLELPIPDTQSASIQEIREIQQRDRIPGVVKRILLVDTETLWEYWWCVPGRMLLPEDVELLNCDRPRVENILEKLVWLFGGYCLSQDSHLQGDHKPIYDWQEILKFAYQQGFDAYILDIDFMPLAIKRDIRHSQPTNEDTDITHIAVEPPHWHVEFLQLTPTQGGFEIKEPKTLCGCQIWTGKPFIKNITTDITATHYDLWVSRPLDITQPPWLK
jgi:hypothetical protein